MPRKTVNVKPFNKAKNVRRDKDTVKNIKVTLLDIDSAIEQHFSEVIAPVVIENNESVKVPIIYADAERWKNIQEDGFLRDVKGKVQLPIIIFKRNSVAKNDSMSLLNRYVNYVYKKKYSLKNRYDKFSLMIGTRPTTELYNVTMPDYVNVSYECMIQTSYIEHMNSIIEQIQFDTEEYWGEKFGYKFKVSIDDFTATTEISENTERVVKTDFTMVVKAYLLPENFANKITTKKAFTSKRLIIVDEIDATYGRIPQSLGGFSGRSMGSVGLQSSRGSQTNFLQLFEYMGMTKTASTTFITNNNTSGSSVVELTNYGLASIPGELSGLISEDDRYQVYINGVIITKSHYTLIDAPSNPPGNSIRIDFDIAKLEYELASTDEVVIIGKFLGT